MNTEAFNAVLILFALAVLGVSRFLQDRRDQRSRWRMEWKALEAFYQIDVGLPPDEVQKAKEEFFRDRGMKAS
jgi:hypothetical protein